MHSALRITSLVIVSDNRTNTLVTVAFSLTHAQTSHRRSTLRGHWLLSASLQTQRCHRARRHFTRVNILDEQTSRIGHFLFFSFGSLSPMGVTPANQTPNNRELSLPQKTLFHLMHSRSNTVDVTVSPVLCADRAQLIIFGAEVRGALQVDQLVVPHRPDVDIFGYQLLACPRRPVDHFGGRQVLGLQVHGDLPQVQQAPPAGSYGAGAGHPMTFTFHHQSISQCLYMRIEDKGLVRAHSVYI